MAVSTAVSEIEPRRASKARVDQAITLYRDMVLAREVDTLEERLVNRGLAAFHVSGAGHEAVAAIAQHLRPADWIHGHYRDKALMIARGLPLRALFDNLLCSDSASSRGRQMSAHFSWRKGNVLSLCGPVGNNALQAVGIAAEVRDRDSQPIVLCCLGDGTVQQGEVMEAIADAVRDHLPVLFLIENNAWAISTTTRGKTFFSLPHGDADAFMGLPLMTIDGSDALACAEQFGQVVARMRTTRGPAIMIMNVERLSNHTHADDQAIYRPAAELSEAARRDPIVRLRANLTAAGVADRVIETLERDAVQAVKRAASAAQDERTIPMTSRSAKRALPPRTAPPARRRAAAKTDGAPLPMGAAIALALRERLQTDERVTLYGQDIEDPKGDVFGLTRGLSTTFGARVANAPLSEATIVGKAVGRALAGGRPVAFLQFVDFLPIAFNQIASELATMFWRTDGEWDCPVIVMAPCGGYRQGLGPFHAQSFEAIACHVPGLDVVCPSTAADAYGLLHAAFDSGRPTLFFYPKALLNDTDAALEGVAPVVELGSASLVRTGADITLVAYGNCVRLCVAAADWLRDGVGLEAEILDLRSLSPLDETAILASVRKTGRLVVVHEDVGTCGLAAEIMALAAETIPGIRMARVVRDETFIPCNFDNQLAVLPAARDVLLEAASLLDLEVEWPEVDAAVDDGLLHVGAPGSPSDETVKLIERIAKPGDRVREGDLLAVFETVKAAVEFEAPVGGVVESVAVAAGDTIKVGAPFLVIRTDRSETARGSGVDLAAAPVLRFRAKADGTATDRALRLKVEVGILAVATSLGAETIVNAEIADRHPGRSAADIERLTGIATRRRVGPGESALTLGVAAARQALDRASLTIRDIAAVVCATGTPGLATPSLACRILHELAGPQFECQAHDVSAACSGYLYGLQAAFDMIQAAPGSRVLLITSEVLSPLVDEDDFETGMLFSDGASATVLGSAAADGMRLVLSRPILSGAGEPGKYLTVPASRATGAITMDGNKVFTSAVKAMSGVLVKACGAESCTVHDLDLIVPHQANARILHAIAGRLGIPIARVASNIRELGNTSSSTIPLCLDELWDEMQTGQKIGLTAFGGGFTFGAAFLRVL